MLSAVQPAPTQMGRPLVDRLLIQADWSGWRFDLVIGGLAVLAPGMTTTMTSYGLVTPTPSGGRQRRPLPAAGTGRHGWCLTGSRPGDFAMN